MKKKIVFICLIMIQFTYSQNDKVEYLLDYNGKSYDYNFVNFNTVLRENEDYSMGFRIVKDSGTVYQANVPKYYKYNLNYTTIKDSLQILTSKKFNDSTIFLLQYCYLDDTCSNSFSNNMTRNLISKRKSYLNSEKKEIEANSNIIFLVLFESEIQLKNKVDNESEYFFSDSHNFLRSNLFKNPTMCGSFALIKPDGLTLIRNGEYGPNSMVNHLDAAIWDVIFKE